MMRRMCSAILAGLTLAQPCLAGDGDPVRGAELFPVRCGDCHAITDGAEKKVGPGLQGLIGRTSGTLEGYDYSEAMKAAGIVWSQDTLMTYLVAPRKVVVGTKMAFNGLKRPGEVEDIVAFLLKAGQ